MTGICGWFDTANDSRADADLLQAMLAPLAGQDTQTCSMQTENAAVAQVARRADVWQQDDILVAIHGSPLWRQSTDQANRSGKIAQHLCEQYTRRGTDVLSSLHGHFSLCILDSRSNSVLLAIDRMGAHSLAYTMAGGRLRFGTSCKSILECPDQRAQIDLQSLYHYFYFHVIPGPETIFQGLQRIRPGHYVHLQNGECREKPYWNIDYTRPATQPMAELEQQFRDLVRVGITESTSDALATGSFLSGGTDSSTIAGYFREIRGEPVETFSMGFDVEGYDEIRYARIAAQHFDTRNHELYLKPEDVVSAIQDIAASYDQPFGNASAIPTLACARFARQHGISRLLGGDGGDELFAGNTRYLKQQIFEYYAKMPTAIRKILLDMPADHAPAWLRRGPVNKLCRYVEQARTPMPDRLESYNVLSWLGVDNIFSRDFLLEISLDAPLSCLRKTYDGAAADGMLHRMLALDLVLTLHDNDLRKVTEMCDLAGVDIAYPFLNDRMVAFSATVPENLKIKNWKLRYFFKHALKDFLPGEILTKPKHGFGLPFGAWMKSHPPLREVILDNISDLKQRGIIRSEFIDELVNSHLDTHSAYFGPLIYLMASLELWLKQNRVTL